MREIKFKAWDGKQWWGAFTLADIYEAGSQSKLDAYWGTDENGLPEFDGMTMVEYTGLKDKNGVEIYEGDVVKPIDDSRHFGNLQIIFRSGQFLPDGSQWSLAGFVSNYECEVIGNIYENPELLS